MIKKRSQEHHSRSSCKHCFPSNFTTASGDDRLRKSSEPTSIGPDTFVTRSRDRLATTASTTTGLFVRIPVKSGTIKKNTVIRDEKQRESVCWTVKENSKKQRENGRSIEKGTVKIGGPGDGRIPREKWKRRRPGELMIAERTANGARGVSSLPGMRWKLRRLIPFVI